MNILISACLLGFDVKYDGTNNSHLLDPLKLERLKKMTNLIPVCPESWGGLECPRQPCERSGEKVITSTGEDKTVQFTKGANQVLKLARMFNCQYALLKENSPSCGAGKIYDGSFTHTLVAGDGVTAELLDQNDIKIFGESKLDELLEAVRLAKMPLQLTFTFE